ncbi:MAG TPA: hypothetical protein VMH31_03335, partial [Methylomirabilota bacterium]|nr:hypothetical protein [Methylomirabilota bacterium]
MKKMSTVKAEVVYYEGAEIKERSGGVPGGGLQVLDQDHGIAFLVIDKFIDKLLGEHQAQAAGAQALCFPFLHVSHGIVGGIIDGGVLEILYLEPWAGVIQTVHQ